MGIDWTMDEVMLYCAGHGLLIPPDFSKMSENHQKLLRGTQKRQKVAKKS